MFLVPINYGAILVCGISAIGIGFLWYGPLFGKVWMKLVNMTGEKMAKREQNMAKTHALSFLSSLVMAYVLAHFIWFTAPGSANIVVGIKTAMWSWLGFVATKELSSYLYAPEKKPVELYAIDTGYYLVTLIVMGTILSV